MPQLPKVLIDSIRGLAKTIGFEARSGDQIFLSVSAMLDVLTSLDSHPFEPQNGFLGGLTEIAFVATATRQMTGGSLFKITVSRACDNHSFVRQNILCELIGVLVIVDSMRSCNEFLSSGPSTFIDALPAVVFKMT